MSDRSAVFWDVAIRRAAAGSVTAAPRDCVRQFPSTNPEMVELIAFDSRSRPRIRVEVPRDEDLGAWGAWLQRWTRRREQRELKATLRIID